MEEVDRLNMQIGDGIKSSIGSSLDGIIDGAKNLGDLFDDLLKDLVKMGVRMAVFGAPSGTGSGGGIFGSVFGFASGGHHRGGARIVGENGPELEITGPSRIYSSRDTRRILGAAGRTDISISVEAVNDAALRDRIQSELDRVIPDIVAASKEGVVTDMGRPSAINSATRRL